MEKCAGANRNAFSLRIGEITLQKHYAEDTAASRRDNRTKYNVVFACKMNCFPH
jgi:hypothetical protein